ncbi:RNA polymerase sigma factor SigZ [bacterium]|nr:RNA polymerase sigma factor SigZ [bacterium]
MEITQLYSQFHNSLLNYIKSKVSNSADAEDILHEVFLKITENIDTLSSKEKIKSWIFSITRNAITDFYRLSSKKAMPIEKPDELIAEDDAPDKIKELECCLQNFIDQLPDEYRSVIIDSELNGIKQKDLIKKYNLAYPSVRSRVQRGREKLKQMFHDCCSIELDSRGRILDAESKSASCRSC